MKKKNYIEEANWIKRKIKNILYTRHYMAHMTYNINIIIINIFLDVIENYYHFNGLS